LLDHIAAGIQAAAQQDDMSMPLRELVDAVITALVDHVAEDPRRVQVLSEISAIESALRYRRVIADRLTAVLAARTRVRGLGDRDDTLIDLAAALLMNGTLSTPLARMAGTAIFLNRGKDTAPLALRANVEHNHVLHEHCVIMSIETVPAPQVPDEERLEVDDLGDIRDGVIHVNAKFGYMERPNVPDALRLLDPRQTEGEIGLDDASYFLSKLELRAGSAPTMRAWRKRLFVATSYIAADAAEYFNLPIDRTVVMGARIQV
jgi:K+ transporter